MPLTFTDPRRSAVSCSKERKCVSGKSLFGQSESAIGGSCFTHQPTSVGSRSGSPAPRGRRGACAVGVSASWGRFRPFPPAPPPPMGWPGSPCRGMGRPGGARAAAAQDGGTAAGPGNGGAGRGWRECGGRWGRLGPRTSQPSPCRPYTPRTWAPARRRRAATGARARTSGANGGRRGGPLGPAQRGRYLLRDHQADPRPGAQVLPLPPVLPGGPGAGLGQGAPRPRARPRASGPILGWCSHPWDTFPSSGSCKPGLQSTFSPRVSELAPATSE